MGTYLVGERQARDRRRAVRVCAFVVGCALGAALICLSLGCATPTKMQLDPTTGVITTTEVGYAVPLTGLVPLTAAVDTTPAEDGSLLGLLFKAAGLYVTARLGQSAVTKSGRANWSVIADGATSWGGTLGAVLHNTIGTSSPREAVDRLPVKPESAA